MRSWKLGQLFGIDIKVHWSFLLILVWAGFSHSLRGGGTTGAAYGVALMSAVFGCVVLHELGHALAARLFGVPTRDITLLPIGGVARLERMPTRPIEELIVALAGPAVNVLIAGVLLLTMTAVGIPIRSFTEAATSSTIAKFASNLLWVNVALVVFNLLPAFPMDGGRVLRAVLATRINYVTATRIAAGVGQAMAVLFAIGGFISNPFLLLIAVFVFTSAAAEAKQVQVRSWLKDIPVQKAMSREFRILSPTDSLSTAAELMLAAYQPAIPIVDDGQLCGVLEHQDLLRGLKADISGSLIRDFMSPAPSQVREDDCLDEVMENMQESGSTSLPVISNGQLVGLISRQRIGEVLRLRSLSTSVRRPATSAPSL